MNNNNNNNNNDDDNLKKLSLCFYESVLLMNNKSCKSNPNDSDNKRNFKLCLDEYKNSHSNTQLNCSSTNNSTSNSSIQYEKTKRKHDESQGNHNSNNRNYPSIIDLTNSNNSNNCIDTDITMKTNQSNTGPNTNTNTNTQPLNSAQQKIFDECKAIDLDAGLSRRAVTEGNCQDVSAALDWIMRQQNNSNSPSTALVTTNNGSCNNNSSNNTNNDKTDNNAIIIAASNNNSNNTNNSNNNNHNNNNNKRVKTSNTNNNLCRTFRFCKGNISRYLTSLPFPIGYLHFIRLYNILQIKGIKLESLKHMYYLNNAFLISRFMSEYNRRKEQNLDLTCIYTFHGAKHKESMNKIIEEGFRLPTDPILQQFQKELYKDRPDYITTCTGIWCSEWPHIAMQHSALLYGHQIWKYLQYPQYFKAQGDDQELSVHIFVCITLIGRENKLPRFLWGDGAPGIGAGPGNDSRNLEKGEAIVVYNEKNIVPLYEIVFNRWVTNGNIAKRIIARVP